jgi:hypothetical protein
MADAYKITSQAQQTQINPAGTGFVDVWNIGVSVTDGPSKGTNFTVSIPEVDHNAAHIKKVIEDKITDLDSVADL